MAHRTRIGRVGVVTIAVIGLALLLPVSQAGNAESFSTAWANAAAKVGGNHTAVVIAESADLNLDGTVDEDDLFRLMAQWHTEGVVPPVAPPEQLVRSQIIGVDIPGDNRPVVTYTLVNKDGDPFDLNTPGLRVRWTIAKITSEGLTNGGTRYENYITQLVESTIRPGESALQPTFDSGGTVTDLGNGQFTYKFSTALQGFDPTLTHVLGGQIDVRDPDTREQITNTNPLFTFRPDGNPVSVTHEFPLTQRCNQCHDPLAMHGGGRKEVGLCVLCHNPSNMDPDSGNSLDMPVLVHKIHRGSDLTAPYVIYGFGDTVFSASEILYPQDIRNCDMCHMGTTAFRSTPSRRACGACHDDVNFETGDGHGPANIPQTNDAACSVSTCHPASGPEFGTSVAGAHQVPLKSSQLAGLNAEILSVTNGKAGMAPTVTFRIFNNAGAGIAAASMNRLRLNIAGPTTDYTHQWLEDARTTSTDIGNGVYEYTFTEAISADAVGTYAVGLEGRGNTFEIVPGDPKSSVREAPYNPVFYFDTATSEPMAGDADGVVLRRDVVDITSRCNVCHNDLRFHGGSRRNTQYCVFCHNPVASAEDMNDSPVTRHFKVMIHKIHTGHDLNMPYSIGNDNYNEVRFPGDRRNCEKCHLEDTWMLPLPEGVSDTVVYDATGTTQVSRTPPITAACTACHDSEDALAHAQSNTAAPGGQEACNVCHGPFRSQSIAVKHARKQE